jgi:hypothetical protein
VVWFVDDGQLVGVIHGCVSPMFGLSFGSFDLWM